MKEDITLQRKYTDLETFKRTIKYFYPVRFKVFLGLLLVLLNVFLSVLLPRITGYYIDAIEVENYLNGSTTILTIIIISSTYLLLIIFNMGFTFLETVILQKAGEEVIFTLRQEVFEKIESLSHDQLYKIPTGTLVTRVTNDTRALNELYTNVLVNLLKYVLTMIFVLVNMMLINYILGLMVLFLALLSLIATIIFKLKIEKALSQERKETSSLNSFLSENLSAMNLIQFYNQEDKKKEEFKTNNNALIHAKRNIMIIYGLYHPFISFLHYLAIAGVFFFGLQMVESQRVFLGVVFSYGMLTSFYNYTASFFGPLQNLTEVLEKMQSGFVSSKRLFNVLDMEPTIVNKVSDEGISPFKGEIEFKHVYFAYTKDNWILKDVSFKVKAGNTVAFVGATGAGKSTILSLISRDYDIQKGEILIDGKNVKDYPLNYLRKNIGLMLQDVFMFSGTIKSNITLNDPRFTDEDVLKAISDVGASKFINKLPLGINSEVFENGANFSSGEKQLISFARVMIRQSTIMILDEATSSIDSKTEKIIQHSLTKFRSKGTMLVVAHRLSTIKSADDIICLNKGQIIEEGTHEELMKKEEYYYKLQMLQLKNKEII